MRRSLLLYLFVFTALVAVFQYVSSRKMLDSKNEKIEELEEELEMIRFKKDSLASVVNSPKLFRLESNEAAMSYFEDRGYKVSEILQRVESAVINKNKASEDNELVPYEGMEGHMRINKVRVVNHKWVLADFTDGTFWGELFITYYIDEDDNLILEAENALLYPRN